MNASAILETIILAAVVAVACFISWRSLRNWRGDKYLCDDCRFNDPTLCLKTERGHALSCTAYESKSAQSA